MCGIDAGEIPSFSCASLRLPLVRLPIRILFRDECTLSESLRDEAFGRSTSLCGAAILSEAVFSSRSCGAAMRIVAAVTERAPPTRRRLFREVLVAPEGILLRRFTFTGAGKHGRARDTQPPGAAVNRRRRIQLWADGG